ncbi:MAG: DUF6647 family protein [Paracoccaceae bacterium]
MRRQYWSTLLALALAAGPSMAETEDHGLLGCPEHALSLHLAVIFLQGMDMAPTVVPCSKRVDDVRLERLYFEGVGYNPGEEVVAALFVRSTGEILVDAEMNFEDPVDLSYFVHELVHMQQMEATSTAVCVGVLEAEAYAIQAAFLRDQGLPREGLLFDLMGQLQAGCASRY